MSLEHLDDIVIVGAARTPNGKLRGAIAMVSAIDLGRAVRGTGQGDTLLLEA
ncbi:MAG: hypothetical protein KIT69_01240 [Propionibacteriaceae bacterium]|nr:hypothetical protein [Propionibacteriaceae bacterium]